MSDERGMIVAGTHVFPPQQGHRRPEWSSKDSKLWTTPEGDITSEIVNPKDSLWLTFKPIERLGRRPKKPHAA